MRIECVTLFPQMFAAVSEHGITGRAVARGLLTLGLWNPRDYAENRHRSVDDRPFGGGPGMVMQVQPLRAAVAAAREAAAGSARVVYLSPQGRPLDQAGVRYLASGPRLILVAGRYEGIDERFVATEVDEEWSVGDYVVSGGELPAMLLIDALARLLPEALGDARSAEEDSFSHGLLDYPHYTRPEVYAGEAVPAVLRSGDHGAIARWRHKQALGRTWERRPALLARRPLSDVEWTLLNEYIDERLARAEGAGPAGGGEG